MKIAGIDLGGTTIKFGIFDDDLRILHKWSCPTPAKASDAAARMAAEIFPFGPDVVGISAAGTVAGGLVTANNLSWTDEPLAALVHEAVGLHNDYQRWPRCPAGRAARRRTARRADRAFIDAGHGHRRRYCAERSVLAQPHRSCARVGSHYHPRRWADLLLRTVRLL